LTYNEPIRDENLFPGGTWEIDNGWDVFGADGEKVGDVHEVQPHYLVVSKGFFFPTERYVPVSAISNVEHDRVYLNVTKEQIDSMGWDVVPEVDTVVTSTETAGIGGYTGSPATVTGDTYAETYTETDRERVSVPVVEEELEVDKHAVQRGSVRVHKDVVEDVQTVNVPLREEEVVVERHPVDRAIAADAIPADAFEETDIEIPLRGEEVDVSKRAIVREEVDIAKTARERTEQVNDTVRREEVHVDEVDRTRRGETFRDTDTDIDVDRGRMPS
jgi:uncharacterized protein (TIGR02271 family)